MKAKAIDHFGPILDKETWLAIFKRCQSKNIDFLMQPTFEDEATKEESGKFIVLDPAKNIIELKFYNSFENTAENQLS